MDIGSRVRSIRLSKSLKLDDLSVSSGLSKSFLSNVENNRTSPSINSLEKIAQALEIPISLLFMQKSYMPVIVKAKQRDRTVFGKDKRAVEWISNMGFSNLEMLILEIPIRDTENEAPLKSHPGEECHLVLEGKLLGTYGTETFILEKGDSFHWDCSVPHKVENIGNKPAKMIIAVSPPSFFANSKAHSPKNGDEAAFVPAEPADAVV